MKVMAREETVNYIKNKIDNGERVVVSRYGDGEYLLMNSKRSAGGETPPAVNNLLKRAIKVKEQLVCVPPALTANTIWGETSRYLTKEGEHSLYGNTSWTSWDFKHKLKVLPYFFRGKVLLVAGNSDAADKIFKPVLPEFKTYSMPIKDASKKYDETLNYIINNNEFDNILFACGPIGKVILSDVINKTNANLVDLGHLMDAILQTENLSSWANGAKRQGNLKKYIDNFLKNI